MKVGIQSRPNVLGDGFYDIYTIRLRSCIHVMYAADEALSIALMAFGDGELSGVRFAS
jgi:hypothetical protein